MRWKAPATWLAIASALLVVLLVWLDRHNTSPGELSDVHARNAAIARDGCEACHAGEGDPGMDAACGECHAAIQEQLANGTGFHGALAADGARCAHCHSEHHGARFPLVSNESFARAGVPEREEYDHAGLGYELTGRHTTLACAECHPNADSLALEDGAKRFLGLEQRCTSCHEDEHDGKLPDCAACHGQEHPFEKVAQFAHTARFPLEGSHARPGCLDCHPKGSTHSIEDSKSDAIRACEDCHASPHAAPFLAEASRARDLAPSAACVACHPVSHTSFAEARGTVTRAEHAATGFALAGPHAELACDRCHSSTAPASEGLPFADFRARHPGRASDDCAACHGDPHGGQFASGAASGVRCLDCHTTEHFLPAAFDVEAHDRTAFALSGAHRAVACGACHTEFKPVNVLGVTKPARVFHGTTSECSTCHVDVHGATFARPSLPAMIEGRDGCERCHDTGSFSPTRAPFDHALWTGFELDGAHAAAACSACHPTLDRPEASGRTFGRASVRFPGDPSRCSTCHADVHGGLFDAAPLPASVDGRADCARCHDGTSFRSVPSFDHGAWTGYPLLGAHARASCESCHPRAARPDAQRRTLGRCAVRAGDAVHDCTSCHVDIHAGAFERAPATLDSEPSCLACHSQETFRVERRTFDHARFTGFALRGAHADLDCAACHTPVPAADGAGAVHGRARGSACTDCHVDPHAAQFAVSGSTDCARCHVDGPDFASLAFDHQRDARFALDAVHEKLDCAACHRPADLPDGTKTVRYKPIGTRCGDCHDPRGVRPR